MALLRLRRWRVIAALFAAVGAGAAAGLATPASASTATQWRIAKVWVRATGHFESIAATAPNNAWAVGATSGGRPMAAHWSGHAWQAVTISGAKNFDLMQVAASSARNVWVFGQGHGTASAFRYDGAHWRTMALPPIGSLVRQNSQALVFGPKDVWLAAWGSCAKIKGKKTCSSDVWHWDGSIWKDHKVGATLTGFTGISDRDLLAVAFTGSKIDAVPGTITAYRWNGSRWTHVSIPHSYGQAPSIAMDTASDVWIEFPKANCCAVTAYHKSGVGWKKISISWTNGGSDPVLDGHGGVWLGAFSHWTGRGWAYVQDNLYRSNDNGWQYGQMVKIPGRARSYWLAGYLIPSSTNINRPMVAVYGPTP